MNLITLLIYHLKGQWASYAFCHDNGNLPTLEGWESACSKLAHFIT